MPSQAVSYAGFVSSLEVATLTLPSTRVQSSVCDRDSDRCSNESTLDVTWHVILSDKYQPMSAHLEDFL